MRRLLLACLLFAPALAAAQSVAPAPLAGGTTSWLERARQRIALQLPLRVGRPHPQTLAFRQTLSWPLGAARPEAAGLLLSNHPASYHYAIPREAFLTEEAFRLYYLDNPQFMRQRMPAPPLTEVPDLHRPRVHDFNIPIF